MGSLSAKVNLDMCFHLHMKGIRVGLYRVSDLRMSAVVEYAGFSHDTGVIVRCAGVIVCRTTDCVSPMPVTHTECLILFKRKSCASASVITVAAEPWSIKARIL